MPPLTTSRSAVVSSRCAVAAAGIDGVRCCSSWVLLMVFSMQASDHRWCGYQLQDALFATVNRFTGDTQIRHFVMAITGVAKGEGGGYRRAKLRDCWRNLAKQPPDAAANYHYEQNHQCNCSHEHCKCCCERQDVHNAVLKCEKHASPDDRPLSKRAVWLAAVDVPIPQMG